MSFTNALYVLIHHKRGRGIKTLKKNLVTTFSPDCSILALYPFPTALVCNQFVIDVYSTLTATISAFWSMR